jgi:site-specific recombinase XerD
MLTSFSMSRLFSIRGSLQFDRIRKRAGISDKPVSPSVLRDTFAVRYLQAGGTLEALRDLLGLRDLEVVHTSVVNFVEV